MRFIFLFVLFLFVSPLQANTELSTQIYDIDMGSTTEEPLIFLASGQVVTYPYGNKSLYASLLKAIAEKTWFKITINDEREILSLTEITAPIAPPVRTHNKSFDPDEPFVPSILKDMDQARSFFYRARTDAKPVSQCFNRAHIWSYEWRIKDNLYSSKAWVFFTRRFIRKHKFEWWFHVAPMVHVAIDGEVKERIMDIKYTKGPVKLKQWTNIFMRDSADCPVVQKYSDQADFPESGSCFVMKSSMYYHQPIDLEILEVEQVEKKKWVPAEVRHAYLEAFDVTL